MKFPNMKKVSFLTVIMGVTSTITTTTAFVLPTTTTATTTTTITTTTTTTLQATIEESPTTSFQLIPPQSAEDIAAQHQVGDMYDTNVQKTYG
jgi:hypothetical protein